MRQLDPRSLYLLSRERTTVRWRTVRERKSGSFWCWEAAPDVAGGRSRSAELGRECVDTWKEGVVVVGGQVRGERSSLSLVRALLRWNKPRLRNDIFSHPSNKLHIQQISGVLPKHFFPLQSLKKRVACRIRLPRHNTGLYLCTYVCMYLFVCLFI